MRKNGEVSAAHSSNRTVSVLLSGETFDKIQVCCLETFVRLLLLSHTVICAQMTPVQKAEVVQLIQNEGKTCLAIGDGGNDVSMVREADVGVGLGGPEGIQAARAADFQLARFAHLAQLLLVHGRYAKYRTSTIALFSFYKSALLALVNVILGGLTGLWSGAPLFDKFELTLYNSLFTILPILALLLDRDVPQLVLHRNPDLYYKPQREGYFTARRLLSWIAVTAYHVFVVCVATYLFALYGILFSGTYDIKMVAIAAFSLILLIQGLVLVGMVRVVTNLALFMIVGNFAFYLILTYILSWSAFLIPLVFWVLPLLLARTPYVAWVLVSAFIAVGIPLTLRQIVESIGGTTELGSLRELASDLKDGYLFSWYATVQNTFRSSDAVPSDALYDPSQIPVHGVRKSRLSCELCGDHSSSMWLTGSIGFEIHHEPQYHLVVRRVRYVNLGTKVEAPFLTTTELTNEQLT